MIGHSKMNEMLHDMTPYVMSLEVSVSPKKAKTKYRHNKHLILIRLNS